MLVTHTKTGQNIGTVQAAKKLGLNKKRRLTNQTSVIQFVLGGILDKIKRIIISGDSRRSTTSQLGNITSFYWSLTAQIEHITGIKPELFVTEDRLTDAEWVKLYDPKHANIKPWIAEQTDLEGCLLLTWEMP